MFSVYLVGFVIFCGFFFFFKQKTAYEMLRSLVGSDDYRLVKTMLYSRPDLMHKILQVNADSVAQYLNAQIEAGAQAVMIFDSWGGVLADGAFQEFSLAYTARVLAQLKREHNGARIPRIVFT